MKVTARILAMIVLLALVVSAPALAQSTQQKPPTPPSQPAAKQPGTPAAKPADQTPAPPPVNAEEEAAFKAFMAAKDPATATKLGEEFVQKYPQSRYAEFSYARLAQSYLNLQQLDKVAGVGEKALALNPDNVDVLAMMCWATARSTRADALDAAPKFAQAEKYGRRAVELLSAMSKPETLTEEEFQKSRNESLSVAHSGLGMVQVNHQQFAEAATEFELAVKLSASPDPTDMFLQGFALKATKRWAEAADAFGRCAAIPGPIVERCKAEQANAKKMAENSLAPVKP